MTESIVRFRPIDKLVELILELDTLLDALS